MERYSIGTFEWPKVSRKEEQILTPPDSTEKHEAREDALKLMVARADVPTRAKDVLGEFKDEALDELPKETTPRKDEEQRMGLVTNLMPSSCTPCRVTPPEIEELVVISQIKVDTKGQIREDVDKDPEAHSIMKLAMEGKTRRPWRRDGLLFAKRGRTFVFKEENLRRDVLKECQESGRAEHRGMHCTIALRNDANYWPKMRVKALRELYRGHLMSG